VPDLVRARIRVGLDESRRGHDLARRAEAALERVSADERVDERVLAQALDRCHLALADHVHERDARVDGDAVEQHGARAAVALGARDLRPGEAKLVSQRLRERRADRHREAVHLTVDLELRHAL
jgi:hypothetical protein